MYGSSRTEQKINGISPLPAVSIYSSDFSCDVTTKLKADLVRQLQYRHLRQ